ncbi:MAG: hypothetical protein LBT79_00150, partial [Elusimicrobiota bacterium]|nr:hypothetical protein [Elusimicrobiota bacterium]
MRKLFVLSIIFIFCFAAKARAVVMTTDTWDGVVDAYTSTTYDAIEISSSIIAEDNIPQLVPYSMTIIGAGYYISGDNLYSGFSLSSNTTIVFEDITFKNFNSSLGLGGAISASDGGIINLNSVNFDIVFTSNSANSQPNDIYLSSSVLIMRAEADRQIRMENGLQAVWGSKVEWSNDAGGSWYMSGVNIFSNIAAGSFIIHSGSSITVDNALWIYTSNTRGDVVLSFAYATFSFLKSAVIFSTNVNTLGGAMKANFASVNFDASTIIFSSNAAGTSGGAFYLTNSTITFINSSASFVFNSAHTYGGALLLNRGTWISEGSFLNFSSNTANEGGALFVEMSSLDFSNSKLLFSSNTSSGNSGGVFLRASQLIVSASSVSFLSNYSKNDNGGGLYLENSSASFYSVLFLFSSNAAYNGGGAVNLKDSQFILSASSGAFISNAANDGAAIRLENSQFIFSASSVTFISNTAVNKGGAIYALNSLIQIDIDSDDIVFKNNEARSGEGDDLYMSASQLLLNIVQDRQIRFEDGIYAESASEINMAGMGLVYLSSRNYFIGITSFTVSGGLYLSVEKSIFQYYRNTEGIFLNSSTINFKNVQIVFGNENISYGNIAAQSSGAALYMRSSTVSFSSSSVEFFNNIAGKGGAIYIADAVSALYFRDLSSLTFGSNSSSDGNGIIEFNGSYIDFSNINVLIAKDNKAQEGGFLYLDGYNLNQLNSSLIEMKFNTAINGSGGALYLRNSNLDFNTRGSIIKFENNTASDSGGTIYVFQSSVIFNETTAAFDHNFAGGMGAAIYVGEFSTNAYKNSVIKFNANTAISSGGALYLGDYAVLSFENSSVNFIANISSQSGGAIFAAGNSSISFINSTFVYTNNIALSSGGAIYAATGLELIYKNSKINFAFNTALNWAGAIGGQYKSLLIEASKIDFTSNTAGEKGGAIVLDNQGYFEFFSGQIDFMGNKSVAINDPEEVGGGAIFVFDLSSIAWTNSSINFINNI